MLATGWPPTSRSMYLQHVHCYVCLQVRRKDELERRLQEIESAQKIFSRRNVLVHATAQQQ